MAYDEILGERVRDAVLARTANDEKHMFGGLCFLVQGNMSCGVIGDDLVVRVGKDSHAAALERPHTRVMDFTGKPMAGWIYVAAEGLESEQALVEWVERGIEFAKSLPAKS
jgi:TfoX/Sxy family transcriptional regulator of competence genes